MRILVVYPYIPYPLDSGTYYRTFHLLRELARVHDVDLLALTEKGQRLEHKDVFSEFCRNVEFVPFEHPEWQKFKERMRNPLAATVRHWFVPQLERAIDRKIAAEKYDVVHLCDIVMAQYFMRRHAQVPLVIDRSRVDLQFQLMEHSRIQLPFPARLLRWENYYKLWRYERIVAARAALQIVCGPDDERFIRRYINSWTNIAVLQNGVDPTYFCPNASAEPRDETPTIMFCGTMDYSPNVDAIGWYFRRIHHRLRRIVPDVRVLIVGKNPIREVTRYAKLPEVTVTGEVPDVRPYYRRAWLQIVPIRIGGGSRLKIVESLAMGTPVVSTSIGAQGLGLCHENDILLADDPESFANQTSRALSDAHLRKMLQRAGLESVCSRLSWQMIGKQLLALYARQFPSPMTPVVLPPPRQAA
jgi:glycosyltransferase involved in cell wall biosynthesis